MTAPVVIHTTIASVEHDPAIADLVTQVRAASDACLFVSGGASQMLPTHDALVRDALTAVARVQRAGVRVAAIDGGTQAGVMAALGHVRASADGAFPLVGVVPAAEVPPRGATPLDPHHSHVVAVTDDSWPVGRSAWGSETPAMFSIGDRIASGRPTVALVANGGPIALEEVTRHVQAQRAVVVLAGTGRAADALARGLGHAAAAAVPDDAALERVIASRGLLAHRDAFVVVPVVAGPDSLTAALLSHLRKSAV